MEKVIECELSAKSFRYAIKEVRKYKEDFIKRVDLFVQRLAEAGVEIAKVQISEMSAVLTGELMSSLGFKPGDVINNGSQWVVYTDCPWAAFVEFGTGFQGATNPHPEAEGWAYDVNDRGKAGWWYVCPPELVGLVEAGTAVRESSDGTLFIWTNGMPSRPFMHNTALALQDGNLISEIAKEVFGG